MASIVDEEIDNENNNQNTSAITREFIGTHDVDGIDFSNANAEDLYNIFTDTKIKGGLIGNFVLRGLNKVPNSCRNLPKYDIMDVF
jgi:hypothetical protein